MELYVFPASEEPIYKQIARQISAQILRGDLPADSTLPPIRTVAKELKVSIITVKKAWEELDRSGLIYTVHGRGSFVAPLKAEQDSPRDLAARQQLEKQLSFYRELGLSKAEFMALIDQMYDK